MATPTFDEAMSFLIETIKAPKRRDLTSYGYDFYLPNIVRAFAMSKSGDPRVADSPATRAISPLFFDAAWELCRRGILRPSVAAIGGQGVTDDGGYSLTLAGVDWLRQADQLHAEAMMPGRLEQILQGFHVAFGDGYLQRAQEAVRCHSATAYLACCVMCGAAAESILLRAAIAKKGDESLILNMYRASGGRKKLEDLIVGQSDKVVAQRFRMLLDILSYRRDDASHGQYSEISEIEAYDALARLLRLSHFMQDHWDELTGSVPGQ